MAILSLLIGFLTYYDVNVKRVKHSASSNGVTIKKNNMTAEELLAAYAAGERDFRGANLSFADLEGADLSFAELSDAYLNGANLSGANLYGADLEGADLRDAYLSSAR